MKYLILFSLCVGAKAISAQLPNDSALNELKNIVEEFKSKIHAPGIAVTIVQDSVVVASYASGYTDIDNKTEVTIDSKFPVMSVTKVFTATMLMQLAEQGVVNISDPVIKYVPEYKVKSPFKGYGPTTLYQLASHNSGLPRVSPAQLKFTQAFDRWMLGDRKPEAMQTLPTVKQELSALQNVQLEYPPYHYVHHNDRLYSNLGYFVLGTALERAARMNYRNYISANILTPLGMNNSGCLSDSTTDPQIAKGYRYNGSAEMESIPLFNPASALYAGGIYSTARDLSKFVSAHWGSGKSILTAESLAMMRMMRIAWRPAFPFVLHEGAMPGYRTIIVLNPATKIGWVVLCNVQDAEFNGINEKLAGLTGKMTGKKNKIPMDQFAGMYSLSKNEKINIHIKNDSLYSDYLPELLSNTPLTPDGDNTFKVQGKTGYTIRYQFVTDENNKVTALKMNSFIWNKNK